MSGRLGVRRVVTAIVLTAAWCGLWGAVSVANVVSGLALSLGVLASGVGTPGRGGIRLLPLLHLTWIVFVDLIRSMIGVAVEILTPTDHTEEAIIAVDVPAASSQHVLLLSVAITLTPGTAVVDADPDSGRLYLHLLHLDKRAATVAHVHRLAKVSSEALPSPATEVAS